ncbi:hypothetical protein EAS61_35485 [Bradyrhizobium zhanjiangense]|uniref:THIF-type NAD/FAD binding fold domain-containing protein n=1 Tax=Bradyrhizobium zhanjiangense TaxID=1325107 RepID=A0A4Q0QAM2_9BRAD|nr:hypothetical protein EAS61_35485 [Bradyrhizobium zhanjiangense]
MPPDPPKLDDWFAGLGDDFLGRVPSGSLRAGMVDGWRLRWRERQLELQVDGDFPFSAARVYLNGYTRAQAQPHIEKNGKLCLGGKPVPGDCIATVRRALSEAFRLLGENETKLHDDDFREDFGLYWLNWSTKTDLIAEVLPGPEGTTRCRLVRAVQTKNQVFVLPTKADAARFWTNRTGSAPKWPKTTALIPIDPLPAPDRYPDTAADLWALVAVRSRHGTDLLARLVDNDPKEAFVVLAGRAPSGREHYAAVRLRRPLDRAGLPVKKRVLRQGLESAEDPLRTLFSRFRVERLATHRLDAASSRLPEGVQRQMAAVRVIIVGCGALGSGVARMLAQAGAEHLVLVDPDSLGWENIRRHELGASFVGHGKAKSLAAAIRAALPMIGFVEGHQKTFATFAREYPAVVEEADLIVSCTGDWAADASVEHTLARLKCRASVIYGWMEAHALASHAVLLGSQGARLSDGFDEHGNPRLPVVVDGKPPPPECAGASTTFGAVELAHAQALVVRVAVDALRGLEAPPAWHSWIADAVAFKEAEASVTSGWAAVRGQPGDMGGLFVGDWSFS